MNDPQEREATVRDRAALWAAARSAILDHPMLTATAAAAALATEPATLDGMIQSGALLALPVGSRDPLPGVSNRLPGHRFHPMVAEINQILEAAVDPWGVAGWWLSPNGRLSTQAPANLVGTGRDADLRDLAGNVVDG